MEVLRYPGLIMKQLKKYSNNLEKIKLLIQRFGPERIKLGEKLSFYTFSKLGGLAEGFFIATSQKELINILEAAFDLKLPFFIFGSGTKILISDNGMDGLVIKNRTGNIKISGIKGKVGRGGLGIEEALIEVDSGVSLGKLNSFLKEQNLAEVMGINSPHATIGGAIFLDPQLQGITNVVRVWEKGDIFEIDALRLQRLNHVVLSVILKVKARV